MLKSESQQFIYDLAKSDLAYYYKKSLDRIEEARKESWKIYHDETVSVREKLLALKIIMDSDVLRFKLLSVLTSKQRLSLSPYIRGRSQSAGCS